MTQTTIANCPRIGYVVKRYPRFSETFIVNEVLAHEAAGAELELFSIRPCTDTNFQNTISRVRAPLTRLSSVSTKWSAIWPQLQTASRQFPQLWDVLGKEQLEDALTVAQGIELAAHVRAKNISHLHAHFATLQAGVTRIAALLAEVPYSLTAHAKDIFHNSVDDRLLERRLSDAAAIVTVSQFNVSNLASRFPQIQDRLHCVYNGLTLAELPYKSPAQRAARIVSVGRLVEKKGLDVLIKACALLRDQSFDFDCEIVGSGEVENALRQLIEQHALEDAVTLTGPLPQSEVKRKLHEAAVFAAPCIVGQDGDRDGLPTVLLESMALGTPCVSTDVTGIPEVIQHKSTGLVVPQHDAAALAAALKTMLTNRELRVEYAEAARTLIDEKFDSARTAQQIRELFAAAAHTNVSLQGAS